MTITVTMEQIVTARRSVERFMSETKLPIKRSYWLGKHFDAVLKEIKRYDREYRKLLEDLGEISPDGQRLEPKPENALTFQKQVLELEAMEVELPIEPLDLDLYEKDKNGKPVEISIWDIWAFSWMFKEPDKTGEKAEPETPD